MDARHQRRRKSSGLKCAAQCIDQSGQIKSDESFWIYDSGFATGSTAFEILVAEEARSAQDKELVCNPAAEFGWEHWQCSR
jgi:hypothetical protein